jgi:hypothetical protein
MEPIPIPKTLKIYQLIRMNTKTSLGFYTAGTSPTGSINYIGPGFYTTLSEAEQNRTLEIIKNQDDSQFYVFELEFPNPAYKE